MTPGKPVMRPDAKILERGSLVAKFGPARDRTKSGIVVFTNGVFDLLHRGHVNYLFAARELGDTLIVGVNTDASVKRLKGPTRPLNRELDRAFVLAGLACVDAVVLFDEDTPAALVDSIVPDVLVKGGDYAPDEVVGRETVERAGGKLVLIPFVQGHSTTSMLERIQEDKS